MFLLQQQTHLQALSFKKRGAGALLPFSCQEQGWGMSFMHGGRENFFARFAQVYGQILQSRTFSGTDAIFLLY
jgi:hypothetical protein